MQSLFLPAKILLPKNRDAAAMKKYCVVACDQYTSQREVWEDVRREVGTAVSSLHLIFPEVYLNDGEQAYQARIAAINAAMKEYLETGALEEMEPSYFYIERRFRSGALRKGLIGMVDLEGYNFARHPQDDIQTPIRATEGTVLSRIPPRVSIRENAPLELPHVMLLIDDPEKKYIEPLGNETSAFEKLYDFDLMQQSGHLTGYKLPQEKNTVIDEMVEALSDKRAFCRKYGLAEAEGKQPLVFAVGDGNHSLATARQCWDNIKQGLSEEERRVHPARYALVEVCNLHDDSLQFEGIHRAVFGADPQKLLAAMAAYYELSFDENAAGQRFYAAVKGKLSPLVIRNPKLQLTVGSLQRFLDDYCKENGGEIDYIHGEEVAIALSRQENCICFLLDAMEKSMLYPTVIRDRALPRKTFSMGHAWDKRFYCEARKIR